MKQTVPLDDSEIYICKIRNILADESLVDPEKEIELQMAQAAPVITTAMTYFTAGKRLGSWGEWKK